MDRMQSERGFSLIELLISVTILLAVTGTIFSLVNPSQGLSRTQPEYSDMQQRARIGADLLSHDLMMAGAGPYLGITTGSLTRFFAPVVPYRLGLLNPDQPGTYRSDAITLVYVPNTNAQTAAEGIVKSGSELTVEPQDHCQGGKLNQLCGFEPGMSVLIFDGTDGAYDTFEITHVQDAASKLQHRGVHFAKAEYPDGAVVTEVHWVHYYLDAATQQLRRYDGINTDLPLLDNVVGLEFQYFGDPNPPLEPKPPLNVENCVIDAAGNPKLPTLAATTGSLIPLGRELFIDGPWCGGGTNQFDADLLRIKQIRIRLRVQASDAAMRPAADALNADSTLAGMFVRPGTGVKATGGWVPDYQMRFEVTPRNLNLAR